MSLRKRLLDLILYVAIAVCIFAAVAAFAIFHVDLSRAWFVFAVATVFLCVFVAKMYWNHRKSAKMWTLISAALIVHIVGYSTLLDHHPDFPDISFLVTVPLEVMLIAAIVKLCLNIMPQRVKL